MKKETLKVVASYMLIAAITTMPAFALAKENGNEGNGHGIAKVHTTSKVKGSENEGNEASSSESIKNPCKAFGHLIAPGFLKHNATTTKSSNCDTPRGITKHLEGGFGHGSHGTTTATTTPTDTTAPGVFVAFTTTDTNSATIYWVTNEQTDSQITYGTTTSYGLSTPLNTSFGFFHVTTITGLTPNTTYHFTAKAHDASNNLGSSGDQTFITKSVMVVDVTAPVLSGLVISNVASTSAMVSWSTNELSTSKVYFGTTTPFSLATASTILNNTLVTTHIMNLTGLTASSTYNVVVQSDDASANSATSSVISFNTLSI